MPSISIIFFTVLIDIIAPRPRSTSAALLSHDGIFELLGLGCRKTKKGRIKYRPVNLPTYRFRSLLWYPFPRPDDLLADLAKRALSSSACTHNAFNIRNCKCLDNLQSSVECLHEYASSSLRKVATSAWRSLCTNGFTKRHLGRHIRIRSRCAVR